MGIFLAFLAMVTIGLESLIAKAVVKNVDPFRILYWRGLAVCLMLLPLSIWLGLDVNAAKAYFLAFAIGVLGYFPVLAFYYSMKVGKLGIVAPIAGSSVLFTVFFSLLLFHQALGIASVIAAFLIVFGGMLLSNQARIKSEKGITREKGIILALVACLLWGLVYALIFIPAREIGAVQTSVFLEFGVFFVAALHLILSGRKPGKIETKHAWGYLGMGLSSAIAMVSFAQALLYAPMAVVSPIFAANTGFVVLGGVLLFQEKLRSHQYWGVVLVLLGVIIVSIAP